LQELPTTLKAGKPLQPGCKPLAVETPFPKKLPIALSPPTSDVAQKVIMRTPKNRLHALQQSLKASPVKKPPLPANLERSRFNRLQLLEHSLGIQLPEQSRPTPPPLATNRPILQSEAKSYDHNEAIKLHTGSVEAMAYDHNAPIELYYNSATGGYAFDQPTDAHVQSGVPSSETAVDAFAIEPFDLPSSAPNPTKTVKSAIAESALPPIPPAVLSPESAPQPVRSAVPASQAFATEPPATKGAQPIEKEVATTDDFLEDLQAILHGQKVYEGNNQPSAAPTPAMAQSQALTEPEPPATLSTQPQPASPHEVFDRLEQGLPPASVATPEPTYSNAHSVFDHMGKNMAYANSFDLGTISLQQRFDEFDRWLDQAEPTSSEAASIPPAEDSLAYEFGLIDRVKNWWKGRFKYDLLEGNEDQEDSEIAAPDEAEPPVNWQGYQHLDDQDIIEQIDLAYQQEMLERLSHFSSLSPPEQESVLTAFIEDFSENDTFISQIEHLYTSEKLTADQIVVLLDNHIQLPVPEDRFDTILEALKHQSLNDQDFEYLVYAIGELKADFAAEPESIKLKKVLQNLNDNFDHFTSQQIIRLMDEGILILEPPQAIQDRKNQAYAIYKQYNALDQALGTPPSQEADNTQSILEQVKEQLRYLPQTVQNIQQFLTDQLTLISDELFSRCEAFFEFFQKLNEEYENSFKVIFSPISKTLKLIKAAIDLWGKLKQLGQLQDQAGDQGEPLPDTLLEAIKYAYKKLIRAFKTALFRALFNAISGISRLVTYLTGGTSAIVTEILELSSDILLKLESTARKFKGVYKWADGTRGVNRFKHAKVIVTFALVNGHPDANQLMATFFPPSKLLPKSLVWNEGARMQTPEEIFKWTNELANKLKSQPA
jgi:hypothetical protein